MPTRRSARQQGTQHRRSDANECGHSVPPGKRSRAERPSRILINGARPPGRLAREARGRAPRHPGSGQLWGVLRMNSPTPLAACPLQQEHRGYEACGRRWIGGATGPCGRCGNGIPLGLGDSARAVAQRSKQNAKRITGSWSTIIVPGAAARAAVSRPRHTERWQERRAHLRRRSGTEHAGHPLDPRVLSMCRRRSSTSA